MNEPTLKRCPFCGNRTAKITMVDLKYHVACGCGISTKGYADVKGSARRWNSRPGQFRGLSQDLEVKQVEQ